jgi:hypothetical protein
MLVVAILHSMIEVLLYHGRVVSKVNMLQSDLVLFVLPASLAFGGYTVILWCSNAFAQKMNSRMIAIIATALAATFISLVCGLMIAFNKYGT